jgi:DNA/RNA endonuclease G (NUC1)
MCGPVVFGHTPSEWIGDSGEFPVAVPDALFKIVVRESSSGLRVLAFLYPQEGWRYKRPKNAPWQYDHVPYLTSVDVIEALTGLDFFTDVPNERALEKKTATMLW